MDVLKVLRDLRAYKMQLDQAIAVFDRLGHKRGKRGGPARKEPARRPLSPEARKRMATAQRVRWAAAGMKNAVPKPNRPSSILRGHARLLSFTA